MGVNFEEIAQKQDRLLANIAEQNRKSYEMFYSPTPADVTLPQYDETGQLINVSIPNRANIKKQIWDDVGGALGQFYRIFYVDSANGNDTGAGTQTDPFKSIKKAIDSVATGGVGVILLANSAEHHIDADIELDNKYIQMESADHAVTNPKVVFDSYLTSTGANGLFRFSTKGHIALYLYDVDIDIGDKVDSNVSWTHASAFYPIFPTNMQVMIRGSKIRMHEDVYNVMFGSFGTYPATINVGITTGTVIENVGYGLIRQINTGTIGLYDDGTNTYTDPSGNALSAADLIIGVVRDANGVPRNVQSNIVI